MLGWNKLRLDIVRLRVQILSPHRGDADGKVMRGIEQIPFLYDVITSVGEWGGLGSWRRWLVQGARGRVLDIGCGTGRNLPLYGPGTSVVAIDPTFDSLMRARRRGPTAMLVQASAEALPFREGTFDTAVAGLVFCSVPDPLQGLAEVKRTLKPNGQMRMLEHVRAKDGSLHSRWQDLIQPAWTRITGGCHPNRDTERNVVSAGFRIEEDGRRARNNWRRFTARKTS